LVLPERSRRPIDGGYNFVPSEARTNACPGQFVQLSIISVIVFARNAGSTIGRTLDSVFAQQSASIELLVLDGASTDGTQKIIERYRNRIHYYCSSPDEGPTAAINEGISRATGDIIALLPADDWLEPGALSRVAAAFDADPDLDVLSCGTRYVRVDESGGERTVARFIDPPTLEFVLANVLRHPLTAGRFIRRRTYVRLGGHSAEYAFGDYDFLVRACLAKVKSKVLPELCYSYRVHPDSRTLALRPETTLIMMRDNMRLAARYLKQTAMGSSDRRALLSLHAGAATRLIFMNLVRGRTHDAMTALRDALDINGLWPFFALHWYAGGALSKLRHSASR
jgi:glycosyltransferase involved in cell wall biosynthesis